MLKSAVCKFVRDSHPYKVERMLNIDSFLFLLQDFEALKKHSASLLKQERELNMKLRHMIG